MHMRASIYTDFARFFFGFKKEKLNKFVLDLCFFRFDSILIFRLQVLKCSNSLIYAIIMYSIYIVSWRFVFI